jgi:rfaE bifunctional protein nucleotidyltransferase chain/domain
VIREKKKSLKQLKRTLSVLRSKSKVIVFTNGCFDILHAGHARYLEAAKKKGDILVVGVNSDHSIKRIKGDKRPVINENNRLDLIAALESVDYAVIFNEDTPLNLIKQLKPDILVKGSDWKEADIVGKDFVSSYGGKVQTIKLVRGLSSTNLINKIAQTF